MSSAESWTVGRLLGWTTDFLKQKGSESPRLDAEILLAQARGCQRIDLYAHFTDEVNEEVRAAFRELVKQRAAGKPVAYLVGRREFYSVMLRVTPDVLIPRPETEFLLIALLDRAKARPADAPPAAIVDVGTGSGAIAICAAKEIGAARVMAIDLSAAALAVAKSNADKHGVAERIEFREGDLLEGLPESPQFDFVVSNPPYVSEGEYAKLARDVREFEPRMALVGGPTGTEIIARLIPQAAARLHIGGWLLLEISPLIADRVVALLTADGRFAPPSITKDLAQHARVVAAQRV